MVPPFSKLLINQDGLEGMAQGLGSGKWSLSFSLFKMGTLSICSRVIVIITEKLGNDGLAVCEHNGSGCTIRVGVTSGVVATT